MFQRWQFWLPWLTLVGAMRVAVADDEGANLFERRIRPVLAAHCLECHGGPQGREKGGLRVDSRESLRRGGESGPAVVPGKPEESLLVTALRHEGLEMPPDRRLPAPVVADFVRWIELGAYDPREELSSDSSAAPPGTASPTVAEARHAWPFTPLADSPPPAVRDAAWPRSEIDRHILAGIEQAGLTPADDAAPRTLVRRLYFDLIGLPPDEAVWRRLAAAPDAERFLDELVDELLASPRFGERWGRHWLDVARYAESSGGGRSLMFPEAWRYRDWVVEAFNRDLPYDQFVRDQLAGDLSPTEDQAERDARLVATGFLVLGPTNYEMQDKELLRMDVVDEQLDTIGRAFLGLSLGCARCHDHKFAPVPTRDYYALAGIFTSTAVLTPGNVSGYVLRALGPAEVGRRHDEHQRLVQDRGAELAKLKRLVGQQPVEQQVQELEAELKRLKQETPPAPPQAMSVRDADQPADGHLHIRGGVRNLGEVVPRGFLTVCLDEASPPPTLSGSGRRELAEWLASEQHPLTARVMVNRVWHHLLGRGIVATPDNFGAAGAPPSHPELLDQLAREFIADGWSLKRLVRRIVSSRAYRLASSATAEQRSIDPDNLWFARARRRRLDAEAIRDAMLMAAGELDLTMGGRTIRKLAEYDQGYEQGEPRRRGVYVPAFRNARLELLEVFDAPNPNLVCGARNVSTLPSQALYLMNNEFSLDIALDAARRTLATPPNGVELATQSGAELDTERLDSLCERLLGRPAETAERQLLEELLAEAGDGGAAREQAWTTLCQLLIASLDFRYLY